jgi:hypothetical protein
MSKIRFERDNNYKWYVVLPEWDGSHEDLLMTAGADILLDILLGNKPDNSVELEVKLESFDHDMELHFVREEYNGGWYQLTSENHNFELWLCEVLKFVFKKLPMIIYIKKY